MCVVSVGFRQVRAVVLIGAALIAVAAVSLAYLRPPTASIPPAASRVSVPTSDGVQPVAPILIQHVNLTGRTDGGYFFWELPGTGFGGHA